MVLSKLEQKQADLRESLNQLRKSLRGHDVDGRILDIDLLDLLDKLKKQQISPTHVLHTYQLQALKLYDNGNSGICEFVREAAEQASNLELSPNSNSLPLYGVPVSIKELCHINGYDSTFGLAKLCFRPAGKDSVIVKALKAQGAIPFVLTCTTQTALSLSGFNPVFGDMSNPYSEDHEPGGSSSGEGVLLALRGSPVGIGTDLGGSIRIPASFCGLAGLKPTSNRLSGRGLAKLDDFHVLDLKVCAGPMGRKTSDLVILMRALLQPCVFKLDPNVPPLPFDESLYSGISQPKLRIGYYETLESENLMQSVPSIRRGVRIAVEILRKLGHEVVPFVPPNPDMAFHMTLKMMSASGPSPIKKMLKGEPVNEHTGFFRIAASVTSGIRSFMDFVARKYYGQPAAIVKNLSGPGNLDRALKMLSERQAYLEQFEYEWNKAGPLDALVCPVLAFPAFPKSLKSVYVSPVTVYTALYNLTDYPAGTVPVSKVIQKDIDEAMQLSHSSNEPISKYDQQILKAQQTSFGLPIGVQVVGQPYKEELVLRVMNELEMELSKHPE